MKLSRSISLWLLLFAASAGLRGQPVVTPTPDRPDEIETSGPYTISNSFEAGYRLSDVSGNRDVYRSSVNFGNGMRLFEGQLRINSQEGKGTLIDELAFYTLGAGDDPYQVNTLRVEKNGVFRYDMQFRIVDYFNMLPALWQGERGFDATRTFQNHDLTLRPGSRLEILLGYDRFKYDGPGLSSEGIEQDFGAFQRDQFIRLTRDLQRENNQYRGGVNVRAAGLAVTFLQAFDNYKEDTRYGNASTLPTQVTNVQPVERLQRDEPIHGNTPVTTIAIRTEKEHRVGFHGRYVYSGGDRNFVLAEDITATDPALDLSSRRQTFVLGKARRDQGSGDFTVTVLPADRWTITNTTSVNNTRINGDAAFVEATVFTTELARFEELGIRHISNATEVNFAPVPKLGLYAAYRLSKRRARTRETFRFQGTGFDAPLFTQENDINSGAAGFRWRPAPQLRISFDAEAGNADLPFTPISDKKFHAETVRLQWRKNGVMIGGSFKSRENDNSASLIDHSTTSRQLGVNGSVTAAGGRLLLDGSYTKLDLDTASGIINLFSPTPFEPRSRSFYASNLHTLNIGARMQPHSRLTLYLGYNLAKDNGDDRGAPSFASDLLPAYPNFGFDGVNFYNSFPLSYQSPLARISIGLSKQLSWNFGWQFYNYSEDFIGDQNYHAHVAYSSLRWSF